jgi:hypothetical protein
VLLAEPNNENRL